MEDVRKYAFYSSSWDGPLSNNRASHFQVELFRNFHLPSHVRSGLSLNSIAIPKETLLKRRQDYFEEKIVELSLKYTLDCSLTTLLTHIIRLPEELLDNVDADVSGLPPVMTESLKRICYSFDADPGTYPGPWDRSWDREYELANGAFDRLLLELGDQDHFQKIRNFFGRLDLALRGEKDDKERTARGEKLWREERDARMAWENEKCQEQGYKTARTSGMTAEEKGDFLEEYETSENSRAITYTTLKVRYLARYYLRQQLVLIQELEKLKSERTEALKRLGELKKKQAAAGEIKIAAAEEKRLLSVITEKEKVLRIAQDELELSGEGLRSAYLYTTQEQGTVPRANTRQTTKRVGAEGTSGGGGRKKRTSEFSPAVPKPLQVDWLETIAPTVFSNVFFVTLPCLGPEYNALDITEKELQDQVFFRYKKLLQDMAKKSLLAQVMMFSFSKCDKDRGWIEAALGIDASRYKEAHLVAPKEFFQAFNFHSYDWTFENPSVSVKNFNNAQSVRFWLSISGMMKERNFAAGAEYEPLVFLECKEIASNKIGGVNRPVLKLIPTDGIEGGAQGSYFYYEAPDSCSIIPFITRDIRYLEFSLRGIRGELLTGSSVSHAGRKHMAPTLLSFTVHEDY